MTLPEHLSRRWPTLNALLDEALALPESQRTVWLDSLTCEPADLKNTLRDLLAEQTRAQDETGLPMLQRLAGPDRQMPASTEPESGDTIGPYALISELGRGGMGAVWLAERADGRPKRRVALKLPHMVRGGALAERLANERDILASLEHPHIARLYDAGLDRAGRPYLAMEYIEGEAIDLYCSRRALPIRDRIGLVLQVAAAVAHAHARLVVHRDLKPSNILVTADGQVRLLDFGIAKLMEGDRTQETSLTMLSGRALTLDYASPEQVRGEPLGTASDVYSLGVVTYELLTGARPYRLKHATTAELEDAIASIAPPLASDAARDPARRKQLRGDIDAILNKALKKDSSQRYATVEALAEDLRRHLNHQPVFAQPDSLGYRLGKFISRYRLQVVTSGIAVLALLTGAGIAVSQARRARAQAARAEEVKGFVLSIFRDADTSAGGSRKTSAADLLEQARARLDAAPVTDPAIRAELLTSLGISLTGLGEYQQAAKVLDEATRVSAAHLGAAHRDTIAAQLALGEALIEAGQAQRAAPYLESAAQGMRQTGNTAGLVNALRWTANLRVDEGRFDEAIASATEAVQLAESRVTPPQKRLMMLAHHTLASTRISAHRDGRLAPARRAYELAREIDGDRLTVDRLNARSLYAYALALEGDLQEAVTELKALVRQQVELLGPNHSDVQRTLGRLGNASLSIGDPLTAIDSFQRALQIELTLDGDQPTADAGRFYLALGRALAGARRYEDASTPLGRANEILTAELTADHDDSRTSAIVTGFVLTRAGRLAEADALFSRLFAHPFTQPQDEAHAKLRLGILRNAQGRQAEAQSLLGEAAAFFSTTTPPVNYAVALAALGEAQVDQGLATDAFDTLMRAMTLFGKLQPNPSPDRADVLVSLSRAQITMGRSDGAVASAAQAAAFWQSFDSTGRSSGVASLWRARALHAAGRRDEAAESLRKASGILTSAGTPAERALLKQTQHDLRPAPALGRR